MQRLIPYLLFLLVSLPTPSRGDEETVDESADRRITQPRHLNMKYAFHPVETLADWETYAAKLRRHILVSAGLRPEPKRCPLRARLFDRLERDGYTVEKVTFQSLRGFLVSGNLYRPAEGEGPFPAVLTPHGHWQRGRLENIERGSIPGRCIQLARMGFVVFSHDMIGKVDSLQLPHNFAGRRENMWGMNLLGLQLWNSIRAVDVLTSLPDVDAERIGCTGASGGGTQTFMLMAVDERIRCAAPVNMVSSIMQGGCLCENAPLLRLWTNNMEIAALMAPRPLLLVAATGDWTRNTMTVEAPAIRSIYRLYGAEDRFDAVIFDAEHNYNRDSREVVYAWFAHWLQDKPRRRRITEQPFSVEPDEALRVFPKGKLPARTKTRDQIVEEFIAAAKMQVALALPKSQPRLEAFQSEFGENLRHVLYCPPAEPEEIHVFRRQRDETTDREQVIIGRRGQGDRVRVTVVAPKTFRRAVVLVSLEGQSALDNRNVAAVVRRLTDAGAAVFVPAPFHYDPERIDGIHHFETYNRTEAAQNVYDTLTTAAYARRRGAGEVVIWGVGDGGIRALLATAMDGEVTAVAVDANRFPRDDDAAWTQRHYIPGLRRCGDLAAAAALVVPRPLLIYNIGQVFRCMDLQLPYRSAGVSDRFTFAEDRLTADALSTWCLSAGNGEGP